MNVMNYCRLDQFLDTDLLAHIKNTKVYFRYSVPYVLFALTITKDGGSGMTIDLCKRRLSQ